MVTKASKKAATEGKAMPMNRYKPGHGTEGHDREVDLPPGRPASEKSNGGPGERGIQRAAGEGERATALAAVDVTA
jgi:hypothetical protein